MLVDVQKSLLSQGLNQHCNWEEKKAETKNSQHMLGGAAS